MKIVNKKELLKYPSGTFYFDYEPYVIGELKIKRETINDADFRQTILSSFDYCSTKDMHDKLEWYGVTGESLPVNLDIDERDALYDDDELYIVYEHGDLIDLQKEIVKALLVAENKAKTQEGE